MIMLNLLMYNKYRLAHFINPPPPPPNPPRTSSLPLILTLFIALSSLPFSAEKKGLHYSLPVLRLWKNYSSQNNVAYVFH